MGGDLTTGGRAERRPVGFGRRAFGGTPTGVRCTALRQTLEMLNDAHAAAAEVGDRIDRLMDGMGDVELLLRPT